MFTKLRVTENGLLSHSDPEERRFNKSRQLYTYIMRTIPDIADLLNHWNFDSQGFLAIYLQRLYLCKENERELISLPTKFGGLGIFNPIERCTVEFNNSRLLTEAMVLR